jgi:hypothetical protein
VLRSDESQIAIPSIFRNGFGGKFSVENSHSRHIGTSTTSKKSLQVFRLQMNARLHPPDASPRIFSAFPVIIFDVFISEHFRNLTFICCSGLPLSVAEFHARLHSSSFALNKAAGYSLTLRELQLVASPVQGLPHAHPWFVGPCSVLVR